MSDNESVGDGMLGSDDEINDSDVEEAVDAAEPEPEDEAKDTFIFYNKQYHKVPYIPKDPETGEVPLNVPGAIRCYFRTVSVPTGKVLGQMMTGLDGWPRGAELGSLVDAAKIVVCNGKIGKTDTHLSIVWYLLVEVTDS